MGQNHSYEYKTYYHVETFKLFLDEDLTKINGTWEDKRAEIRPEKDIEPLVTQLLVRDVAWAGRKDVIAILSGTLNGSLKNNIKEAYHNNIGCERVPLTEEEDYIYEIFARMIARNCAEDETARRKVVSLYKDRYPDEYKMVIDFAKTYENESNDENAVSSMLLSLFLRATNYKDNDDMSVRLFAILLFMADESINCGHTLPYHFVVVDAWAEEHDTIFDKQAIAFPFMCRVLDKLNNYGKKEPVDLIKIEAAHKFGKGMNPRIEATGNIKERENKRNVILDKYFRERLRALSKYIGSEFDQNDIPNSKIKAAEKIWEIGYEKKVERECIYSLVADRSSYRSRFAHNGMERSRDEDKGEYIDLMQETLLDLYYMLKLDRILEEKDRDGTINNVTRHDVIKEIGMDDIPKDAEFLINMSYAASAFKSMNKLQDMYIDAVDLVGDRDTSADRFHSLYKNETEKYTKRIADQKKEIESLKKTVDILSKKDTGKKNSNAEDVTKLAREVQSLEDALSEKNEELDEAEKRNAELLEYIEMMEADNRNDGNDETAVFDPAVIRGKRFVFVCHDIDVLYPGLRHEFPDSVFMENLSTPAATGNIDAIVFIIKHISHSLYFKAKSLYDGYPMVYFTRRNPDEMYRLLAEVVA